MPYCEGGGRQVVLKGLAGSTGIDWKMIATNCCTRVLGSCTRWAASKGWGAIVVGLFLLVGGLLLATVAGRTWNRLDKLQQEFAAMETEGYLLGVRLGSNLERLNATLLRFQLSKGDPAERSRFGQEARRFTDLLAAGKPALATAAERELAAQIEAGFQTYQLHVAPLLEKGVRAVRRDSAAEVSDQINALSVPLAELCDRLAQAQKASWKSFLSTSHNNLGGLWRSALIGLLLLLTLAALVFLLAYRFTVTPLRFELSEARSVLERQEKLASLGTLAAGVAHEIRNPLASLKFRLFSLKQSMLPDADSSEDLAVIDDEINRLERITSDFLQFARPSKPAMSEITAQQVLQTVYDLLKPQLETRGIRTVLEPGAQISLQADRHQLEQVLINLVQNAADSIEGGGTITLRVRQGAARLAGRSKPAAILEISDTGKGIPPEVQKRLFDPFFSSKAGGTGLGLSISERIIEMHGGFIQYQTQINRGTTFQIVLPHAPAHASQDTAH
jgi:signal transduction histidine kinase